MVPKKRQKVNSAKFMVGDIVHIPQDVPMWTSEKTSRTTTPTTGVVLSEDQYTLIVFVNGRKMTTSKKHVYPYKEEYNEGN